MVLVVLLSGSLASSALARPPEIRLGITPVGMRASVPDPGGILGDRYPVEGTFFPLTLTGGAKLDRWESWDLGPHLSFSPDTYGRNRTTHHQLLVGGTFGPVLSLSSSVCLAINGRLGVAVDRLVFRESKSWAVGPGVGAAVRLDYLVAEMFKVWIRLSSSFSHTWGEADTVSSFTGEPITVPVDAGSWELIGVGVGGTFVLE